MSENIVFKDEEGRNYIVSFPILHQAEPSVLRLWVEYCKGGYSYYHNKEFKRGYYLYMSVEECSDMARVLVCSGHNHKVLLGEVSRKSEKAYRQFAEQAGACAKELVREIYKDVFEIDLESGVSACYGRYSSAIGGYKDIYF